MRLRQEAVDVAIVGGGLPGLLTAVAVRQACPGESGVLESTL